MSTRARWAFALLLGAVAALGGCGGGGGGGDDDEGDDNTLSGVAESPDGVLARAEPAPLRHWLARLGLPAAWAQMASGLTPLANANVFLVRLDSFGAPVSTLAQTATDAQGRYAVQLPAGTRFAGDLAVQVSYLPAPQPIATQGTLTAPAVQSSMNIHPATELVMRRVLSYVANTGSPSLTVYSPAALSELVRVTEAAMIAIPAAPGSTIEDWINHLNVTLGAELGSAVTRLATGVSGLIFFTAALPDGQVGTSYGPAGGGGFPILALSVPPAALTYTVTSGQLPDGLTLDASSGKLSGIPLTANAFSFTVRVSSPAFSSSRGFTVTVVAGTFSGASARIAAGGADPGGGFSLAIARPSNGGPQSWGSDMFGMLGDDFADTTRNAPDIMATGVSDALSVSAGLLHGVAVLASGEVRSWGLNTAGQLGTGDFITKQVAVAMRESLGGTDITGVQAACAGGQQSGVLRGDGKVMVTGTLLSAQTDAMLVEVPGIANAAAIACGGAHMLALVNGNVLAWGENGDGQLGDGGKTARAAPVQVGALVNVKHIAAGLDHSLAASDTAIWGWGSNTNGKLGDGTENERLTPARVNLPAQFVTPVVAVAAGGEVSLALDSAGVVYVWGINEVGQLGTGSLSPGFRENPGRVPNFPPSGRKVVEITVSMHRGVEHIVVVLDNGEVRAWGNNLEGQLGHGSGNALESAPVRVGGLNLN